MPNIILQATAELKAKSKIPSFHHKRKDNRIKTLSKFILGSTNFPASSIILCDVPL